MIADLIATLRQYAADPPSGPKLKYENPDLRRVIVRAINFIPQLQTPKDGAYIRSREHVPIFFDSPDAFSNPSNVTIDGHLHLTSTVSLGVVDRVIAQSELKADFADLLFAYFEAKQKGSGPDGPLTVDISLDGGETFLVEDGFEDEIALNEYLDLSSYAKQGFIARFSLATGSRVVDSVQLYLTFLKRNYFLLYSSSIENAAKYLITEDLRSEAIRKGYDITVINALALAASDLLRMATGRTQRGEPLEKPQGEDPGRGMKSSVLAGTGRDDARKPIEDTAYGKSVSRVFDA